MCIICTVHLLVAVRNISVFCITFAVDKIDYYAHHNYDEK